MSDVIIFKLNTQEEYEGWYEFLNWKNNAIEEISHWDDSAYSNTIYKAYRVSEPSELTYILLKWSPIFKGDYLDWMVMKRNIEATIYRDEDINWIEDLNKDD